MRVLVTGADGFIGTHLVPELEGNGHEVMVTDRQDADLALPGQAQYLVEYVEPEYVIHLAARYGRILCRDEPHRAVADNTAATTELAAACAAANIPVLYASSSEVYGDHGEDRIYEDSELRTPTTIYGLSKRWGEEALRLYLPPEQLTIVRANMLYGEKQRAGYGCCALATFIKKAIEGEPFTVHRGASRSWLYISDGVRALAQIVEGGHTGVFNLSNDQEQCSMQDIAEAVLEAVGSGIYELEDAPSFQILKKVYSSAKLRATIDWQPEVDLTEGIRRTVEAQMREPVPSYA